MYNPSVGPYSGGFSPFFDPAAYEEKKRLRSTANAVCLTALIGVLLMTIVLPLACSFYLSAQGFRFQQTDFNGISPVMYYLTIAVNYLFGLALPVLLFFAVRHTPMSEGLPFRRVGALNLLLFTAFGCMICMLANYPANWVSVVEQSFGFSGTLPSMPLTDSPAVLALYALNVIVIPPLVEEIMFRGVVLQSMRRFGDGFAVFFSALLFGLYHGNFIQMVFAFVCGLALGYVVVRTNSLLPGLLIHFINNAVSLAVELTNRFYGADLANQLDSIVSIVLVAAGLLALLVLALTHRLTGEKKDARQLPLSERVGAAIGNPGAILFLIYGVASSVVSLIQNG